MGVPMHRKVPRPVVWYVIAPVCMLLLLEGFSRSNPMSVFGWLFQYPLAFLYSLGLMAGVCLLPAWMKSTKAHDLTLLALAFLSALYGIVNHYKLIFRLEPILLTDVTQIRDAIEVTALGFDINWVMIALVLLTFAAALIMLLKFLPPKQVKRNFVLPVLGVALILWLVSMGRFSLFSFHNATDMNEQAKKNGSLFTLIAMDRYRTSLMNIDYQQPEVEASYARLQQEAPLEDPDAKKPNIILVLSESFTDEAILGEYLDLTEPLMPFYQSLLPECQRGLVYVPKAGGGTSESEFEVLSALRSKYALNPYSIGLPPIRSIADILGDKGYTASAIHWHVGVFYNRYHNLRMQGFDSFKTLDTSCYPFERIGSATTDSEHYASAMEQLRLSEGRDFVFLLTMQNHGGYTYFDFREKYGANTPFTNSLSAESEKVAANFCYLLKESDKALEKWIEELRAFEEPTVVIFFSDHLAPLGTNVLQELGLPVSGDAAHQVPYFIWSNDDSIQPGETDLYAYELSPYALSLLGLCDDPFFAYVEKLRSQGIHSDETYDLLSYDALFGQQYAYQMAGFAPATDTFHIGGDMTLSGFDAVEAGDRICVRPRLAEPYQRYTLYLNGKAVEGNLIPVSDKPFTLACIMHSDGGKDYNRSQTLTYENTDQLLQGCDGLHCEPLNLGELSYFMVRNEALNGCTVWATEEPIGMWTHTALLSAEGIWQQKSSNALHKTLQYSIDTEGRLWVSVPNQALPELLTQRVQQYLSSQQAQLYLLDK